MPPIPLMFIAGGAPASSIVGVVVTNGGGTVNYPAGTSVGNLAIVVNHGFSVTAPSGYTLAFGTTADPNGYAKSASYRIIQSGDSSVTMGSGGGFDGTLIVISGKTAVSSSHAWGYATAGGSTDLNSPSGVTGLLVAIASDRGATAGGFPSISTSGGFDQTNTGSATFFNQRNAIKLSISSQATVTFTDYNDVYGTSCLILIAT